MDNFKDIEISGRKFRISKFNAMTGAKIIKKLLPIAASFINAAEDKKPKDLKVDAAGVIAALTDIKDEDFEYVQRACLKVVSENLPAGYAQVLNDSGSFGVVDLENDTMTVLALTAHALMFNVTGFFVGSPLQGLVSGILNSFPQD